MGDLEYHVDFSSATYQRTFVRNEISPIHATGGQSVSRVNHHPVNGPYSLSVLENAQVVQVSSETNVARRLYCRNSVHFCRMRRIKLRREYRVS